MKELANVKLCQSFFWKVKQHYRIPLRAQVETDEISYYSCSFQVTECKLEVIHPKGKIISFFFNKLSMILSIFMILKGANVVFWPDPPQIYTAHVGDFM